MSIPAQIAIAFVSVAVLIGLMALVRRFATARGWSAEVQRKLVHIGTGLYALTLPWLFSDRWPVLMLIALTLVVMTVLRLPGIARGGLGETLHGVERQSYGDFLLAISVGLVFVLADDQPVLYVLPIAVLTLADAAAALTGTAYGRRFFMLADGEKSLEGSTIFFLVTLVIAMICLLLFSQVERVNVIVLAIMIAAFGALVEADSWQGFDNLFLPLGLYVFLAANLTATPVDLLLQLGAFLVALVAFRAVSTRFGLSAHSARVYVMVAFLLLTVTALQNALLPLLALGAHVRARTAAPGPSRFPDLDIVAGLGLMSFGWLGVGSGMEMNTIGFYAISAMGMTIGFAVLSLRGMSLAVRALIGAILAAALASLCLWVIGLNPQAAWAGDVTRTVVAALVLAGGVPLLWPGLFVRGRVAWVTGLAVAAPLGAFIMAAM